MVKVPPTDERVLATIELVHYVNKYNVHNIYT